MRRLLLLRHAKSERGVPGSPDRDRTLNRRGRDDCATMGAYMARHRLTPGFAVISAATRTRETWSLLGTSFTPPPAAVFEERLYNAGRDDILGVITETEPAAKSLLVVGHNPGLHEVALELIASGDVEARERLGEGLPTTGLVVIDLAFDDWNKLHPRAGRLDRFVTPKSLTAATD